MKMVIGVDVSLPTLILTFDLLHFPNEVSAAWYRLKAKPYIPTLRYCYHCQVFGHASKIVVNNKKEKQAICAVCCQQEHGECNRAPCCVH